MAESRILAGTTKGLFVIDGETGRSGWTVRGPFCDGWTINHAIGDAESGAIWAAGGNEWFGAGVWRSADAGESWRVVQFTHGVREGFVASDPDSAAKLGFAASPPAAFSGGVDALWSLGLQGGRLYAGAKPAAHYVSDDGGETWARVEALTDHPTAADWNPGAAGLTLHTIVGAPDDPGRLWVGISAAGVFASEDGGVSWDRRTRRANDPGAAALGSHPASGTAEEIGHCVHNLARAPGGAGDLLYQQNHHGVFRSPDGGRSWQDITAGLPSSFGFPVAVHPRDPDTLWVFPLNGDTQGRFPPDASAKVWKSVDGGASWQGKGDGLPEKACFFTVLRQAMATDAGDPAGVYFGTNTGSVFASADEGESWSEIARHLPTVLSVEIVARN